MRLELHCHSTVSDGSLPAAAVAQAAADRGVELFCLTDHDSCAGFADTRAVLGARALRGVELSCHDDGRTVHLLLYDTGGDWTPVDHALTEQAAARRQRLRAMAERLAELGVPVDVDGILAAAGERTVGRPDLARALVDAGHVKNTGQAYSRYLRDGGPADVTVRRLTVGDGVDLGRAAGARMSLAHPDTVRDRVQAIFAAQRERGLDGIEAVYGGYRAQERRRWTRLADELGLIVTAGSDFHGATLPSIPAPGIDLDDARAARLCDWLGVERPGSR